MPRPPWPPPSAAGRCSFGRCPPGGPPAPPPPGPPAWGGALLLFGRLHHGGAPRAYIGTQGGVALIMVMVSGRGPPETLVPALERLAGATLGTALVIGLSLLLASQTGP